MAAARDAKQAPAAAVLRLRARRTSPLRVTDFNGRAVGAHRGSTGVRRFQRSAPRLPRPARTCSPGGSGRGAACYADSTAARGSNTAQVPVAPGVCVSYVMPSAWRGKQRRLSPNDFPGAKCDPVRPGRHHQARMLPHLGPSPSRAYRGYFANSLSWVGGRLE
jgi:hypothetical protein